MDKTNTTWTLRLLPVRRIMVKPDEVVTARLLGSRNPGQADERFHNFFAEKSREILRFIKPQAVAAVGNGDRVCLVLTLGKIFDRYLTRPDIAEDLYARAVLSAMGDSCLFALEEEVRPHLRRLLHEMHMGIDCRLPESAAAVKEVCLAAQSQRTVGVTVTPDGTMEPTKSMALAYAATDDETRFAFDHDCSACTSVDCPMKSAGKGQGKTVQTAAVASQEQSTGSQPGVLCSPHINVLATLQKKGIHLPAPCGGRGLCGKCRIRTVRGSLPIHPEDRRFLTEKELENGIRLACCAVPETEVIVEPLYEEETMEIAGLDIKASHYEGKAMKFTDNSRLETGSMKRNVTQTANSTHSKSGRADSGNMGRSEIRCGIAVDLGTTTIAGALIDLATGEVLAQSSTINHQRFYGADVVSRMMASMDGKREDLRNIAHKDIEDLCRSLTQGQFKNEEFSSSLKTGHVKKVVIAGNTAMEHMYAGDPCDGLAAFPFHPVSLDRREAGGATLLPGISAYVGADILAGMYALSQTEEGKPFLTYREGGEERTCLFLDLGTNGEMAISKGDTIYVASTAAGPALEGGNISCGTGSIPGAISRVRIAKESADGQRYEEAGRIGGQTGGNSGRMSGQIDGKAGKRRSYTDTDSSLAVNVETIGDTSPVGICGTGIIEALAEFLRTGIMDSTGRLLGKHFHEGVTLVPGITISQDDVRQVQMAKGAICAGLKILMERAEVDAYDIDALYLAGGFGLKLDPVRAGAIGLIPQDLVGKTRAVGNTSLMGAVHSLIDPAAERVMEEIRSRCREIILGNEPGFEARYIEEMDFPSAL